MKHFLLSLAALGLAASFPLYAAVKAPFAGDPAKAVPIVKSVCSACHGMHGNSTSPANPKLSAQHADYIYKQLSDFKSENGKPPKRTNPIMNGMAAGLSKQDMRNLAVYFSEQKRVPAVAKDKDTVIFARDLYRAGDPHTGVPACAACHGPSGAGIPGEFPLIAGQFASYTASQLDAFRSGKRANDPNKMMRMIAIRLTDPQIKALADYIAGLR